MFYPKSFGPETQTQQIAMLHSQLSAAYSIIAQYEDQEEDRKRQKVFRDMMGARVKTHIAVDKSTHVGPAHPCAECDALERVSRHFSERGERPPGEDPDPFAPAPDPFAPQPDPFDGKTSRKQDADRPTGPSDGDGEWFDDPTVEDDGRC